MSSPSGCDFSHLVAPRNVLVLMYSILAMAMSNLVVGSFTLVLFIVLVAVYSFWRRFVHFGGNPRFGGEFYHFGGSLIGSLLPTLPTFCAFPPPKTPGSGFQHFPLG